MNTIATFKLCKLSDKNLLQKVDKGTDKMYKTGEIPTRTRLKEELRRECMAMGVILCVDCGLPEQDCTCEVEVEYRRLKKGEKILKTDEYLDDDRWVLTTCAGDLAPDPQYTCHREYRRRL